MKLDFTGDQARDIIFNDNEDFEVIEDEIYETSRWSEHHSVIIKHCPSGKFYSTYYSRGLTEMQDEQPWEHDKPEFEEVEPYETTIISYRRVVEE